jgi:hypothetical protein
MKYTLLKHKTISLNPKEELKLDFSPEMMLIPDDGSKIFLHWRNDSAKLLATYTMTFPTKVEGVVFAINGLDKPTKIKIIW